MQRLFSRQRLSLAILLGLFLAASYGLFAATTARPANEVQQWTVDAISDDEATASRAIDSLRSMGPEGLTAFSAAHAEGLEQLRQNPVCDCESSSPKRRLAHAVDRIAGQRNAASSGLYWYTDFALAQSVAKREEKPIISLRLLGQLTEELSCANSRFFRTILYADPAIADCLRNEFVLHWQSVRPVPKITVDFGDGRRLERTITGNSAHYVLDYQGRVVDVLPGLYSPQVFLRELRRMAEVARQLGPVDDEPRTARLASYHRDRQSVLTKEMAPTQSTSEENRVGMSAPNMFSEDLDIPVPKGSSEQFLVRTVTPDALPDVPSEQEPMGYDRVAGVEPDVLAGLALRMLEESGFSQESETLMRAKIAAMPTEYLPGPLPTVQDKVLARLMLTVAFDTARNEYGFHRQIHGWLAAEPNLDLERLNDRVYADLFLTPHEAPWLGLLNIEAFSAVDACGIVIEK